MLFNALSFLCLAAASQASPVANSLLESRQILNLGGLVGKDGKLLGGPGALVQVPLSTFNGIQLYTKYAAYGIARSRECVKPPYSAKVVDFISTQATDSQATIFENEATKEYIIAFPGTHSAEDSSLDKMKKLIPFKTAGVTPESCSGCRVHQGYQIAWNAMVPLISEFLNKNLAIHKDYTVTIVGHSLGGGLASIATASLKGQGYPVGNTYTFGQPRTGNQQYADHIDQISGATELIPGTFFRVTHANDGVPSFPRRSLGYVHHRTEYWERDAPNGRQGPKRTFRCFGQEPKNCNLSTKHSKATDAAHGLYSNVKFGGRYLTCPGDPGQS